MNALTNLQLVLWLTLHFTLIWCSENKLKILRATFHKNTKEGIKTFMIKKDTCIISLIIFYESKTKGPIKVYRVLSCVLYYSIENYVCIEYLCCKFKTLSIISSDKIFKQASYNILLGIGIPEVLIYLVYCHVFMEKPNSTVIFNCRYCLVN